MVYILIMVPITNYEELDDIQVIIPNYGYNY